VPGGFIDALEFQWSDKITYIGYSQVPEVSAQPDGGAAAGELQWRNDAQNHPRIYTLTFKAY